MWFIKKAYSDPVGLFIKDPGGSLTLGRTAGVPVLLSALATVIFYGGTVAPGLKHPALQAIIMLPALFLSGLGFYLILGLGLNAAVVFAGAEKKSLVTALTVLAAGSVYLLPLVALSVLNGTWFAWIGTYFSGAFLIVSFALTGYLTHRFYALPAGKAYVACAATFLGAAIILSIAAKIV